MEYTPIDARSVHILGTPYTVIVKKYDEEKDFERLGCAGLCFARRKEIVLCDMTSYKGWENSTPEDAASEQRHILRHEIVHAFLEESGLSTNSFTLENGECAWARNEEMIDWIALQGPKIYKAWQEADAL